ncbi:RING-H2 finger protein ATL22 [Daucus carota subsp. sativus]|uniref:RING-H2 finger protein ATL22 n=1 Tax=Daucus carota subsp. sativus TaxID=79200 RepID=UPI0007EF1361|nr:PREDICTED: RING-H2 finger protein ATL22-like isoform X2 [Daucus carota subsp. sativus]XP_017228325.1 PREDICTED: RING-H2 finger protein ATL22-like isoform X2 [Daucus carota subsp. sativus]
MAMIKTLFPPTLFIIFSITHTVLCAETCNSTSCSPLGPTVRFPFRLSNQPRHCGFPGFDLSCSNQSELMINLNLAGDFQVTDIDYMEQTIYIKPEFCPPNRIGAFNPLDSPFIMGLREEYYFFNCSSSAWFFPGVEVVKCFPGEDGNKTVAAIPRRFFDEFMNQGLGDSCQFINFKISTLVGFVWAAPNSSAKSLSTAAKYGIVVGVGLPGIFLLVCLARFARRKMKERAHIQLRHSVQNLPTTRISLTPPRYVMGLDKATINSYPMTVLGESKRLPKPSDSTCAICLSEYQPNDKLRTVPECNHYFHSNCIDEWLKLNASCPVCRNFPEGSSGRTAADPMSSSSSPTSLFSN